MIFTDPVWVVFWGCTPAHLISLVVWMGVL